MRTQEELRQMLQTNLKELRLPTIRKCWQEAAGIAETENMSPEEYLLELTERECEERRKKRVQRELRRSGLPLEKSLETLDTKRFPAGARRKIRTLVGGDFLARTENVLAFGKPGSGKTHALSAIGQELIRSSGGWTRVYFASCSHLVQRLLAAKKELELADELRTLSRYDAIIIDDLGYVQQSREEMEVLFTLLAHRYERGSVMITSNLPFSKWEKIFKDPMTTAAAIDRLVHHSVILELNVPSYRLEESKEKARRQKKNGEQEKNA